MSNLGPANMLWNSTGISSKAFRASVSNTESVQSKLDKICIPDPRLSFGLSCSNFCKAISSRNLPFWIGVCWVSSTGSWGVGNQYVSLDSSNLAFSILGLCTGWHHRDWRLKDELRTLGWMAWCILLDLMTKIRK